jgi:hypothetical protein
MPRVGIIYHSKAPFAEKYARLDRDQRLLSGWRPAQPPGSSAPDYLHCPLFLRLSIVCKQFDAHIQPGVAHFFEQTFMQALTSQLTASADGAKATESP